MKKLAFYFSVSNPNTDLTVSSVTSTDILKENMNIYDTGLNEIETKILHEIREKYLKSLNFM